MFPNNGFWTWLKHMRDRIFLSVLCNTLNKETIQSISSLYVFICTGLDRPHKLNNDDGTPRENNNTSSL